MSRYRSGPWPGLTPRGAGLLLACGVFLAIGQIMVGPPARPLPDLVVVGVTALVPMVLGSRIVRTAGAASAICGVYLLPASTVSLLAPSIPPPPLLLVPAIVFDVVLWLEPAHIAALLDLLPGRKPRPRTHNRAWQPTRTRAIAAGAAFGLVLGLVEPAFRVFLGDDPAIWSGSNLAASLALTTLACAGVASLFTVRGRAA